jgi:hypothetical protein
MKKKNTRARILSSRLMLDKICIGLPNNFLSLLMILTLDLSSKMIKYRLRLHKGKIRKKILTIQLINQKMKRMKMKITTKFMRHITIIIHSKSFMMEHHLRIMVQEVLEELSILEGVFLMKTMCCPNRLRSKFLYQMSSFVSLGR